jgi:hypothetical protein
VLALNLVKQHEKRPRETVIGGRFGESVQFINEFLPSDFKIDYYAYDELCCVCSCACLMIDDCELCAVAAVVFACAIGVCSWDFKEVSRSKTTSIVDELSSVIGHWALQRNGLFHSHPAPNAVLADGGCKGIAPNRYV